MLISEEAPDSWPGAQWRNLSPRVHGSLCSWKVPVCISWKGWLWWWAGPFSSTPSLPVLLQWLPGLKSRAAAGFTSAWLSRLSYFVSSH